MANKLLMIQVINVLLFFSLFFLVASAEMATMAAGEKLCQKRSKTWSGPCIKTGNCDKQCKTWERAFHGACHKDGLRFACFCYFKC